MEIGRSIRTVHDLFRDPEFDIIDAVVATAWPNLWCLPADPLYEGTGREGVGVSLLRSHLRRSEMTAYDVIVLDTPPALDLLLTNALAAADGVLIPLLAHALSSEGVKQLSRLFYKTVTTVNPDLKLQGVLPVMASPRIGHHRAVIADIGRQFGAERILRPIRSDIQLAAAFEARQPIRFFAPRSRGALDYYLLADDVAGSWHRSPVRAGGSDSTLMNLALAGATTDIGTIGFRPPKHQQKVP